MNEQEQFWKEFTDLKTQGYYLNYYHISTGRHDVSIEAFLAVAAVSSIGSWAAFQVYPLLWGGIIAASQVIHAVKPFFPYKKRLESIGGLSLDLAPLLLICEDDWYRISTGELTPSEIHARRMKVKRAVIDAVRKHFGPKPLPTNDSCLQKAIADAHSYFTSYYGS